jgi:hypothetical protein
MSIHLGEFAIDVPANVQLFVDSQADFSVLEVDKKGKTLNFIGNSIDRAWKGTITRDCKLKFTVPKLMHTSVDAIGIRPPHEVVSDIPVEVDVPIVPKDLQTQIKEFAAQLVVERYGRDSDEVDTFEDMMDFDIPDDDDVLLSGNEVVDLIEQVPIDETEEEIQPEENSQPTPEETPPPETPPGQ